MRYLMCALLAMGAMCLQAAAETAKPAVGSDEVYWVVSFTIPQGQLDKFKQVVAPLVADTRNEPGTLAYEYNVSADQSTVDIYERYRNSAGVLAQVQMFGAKYSKPFLEIAKLRSFVVYGAPTAEAKKALEGFNPVYLTAFDGFSRDKIAAEATGSTSPPATPAATK
jgi:quinol monooxygenase YgiN